MFVFGYDWRLSSTENSIKLHDYIQCVQKFYPGADVNIVAHSMGGLVARRYLLDYTLNHHVKKMITIASPYLGAPKAIDVLLTGRFLGKETFLGGFYFHNEKIKQIALYGKGIHELLPSDWYFDLGGRPFKEEFDINKNQIFPELYPTLPELAFWLDTNLSASPLDGSVPYQNSRDFHTFPNFISKAGQDDWREDVAGVEYHHIYGQKFGVPDNVIGTIGEVIIDSVKSRSSTDIRERYNYSREYTYGDGTVPLLSSTRESKNQTLNFELAELIPFIVSDTEENQNVDHNGLMGNQNVFDEILNILDDSEKLSSEKSTISMSSIEKPTPPLRPSGKISREERKLYVEKYRAYMEKVEKYVEQQKSLGFPTQPEHYYLSVTGVDRLDITDSQGNTNTNLGNADLAVPNVHYEYGSGPGENLVVPHEVRMPIDNNFDIKFRTSSDIMEVKIVKGITEKIGSRVVKYLDINLPVGVTAWLRFTPQGVMDLRYDTNGDGVFESTLAPTYDLTGDAAKDVTAPQISINTEISGNSATVSITASDSETGVKEVYYQVKDSDTPRKYTAPFTINILQSKFITAYAEDNAGNRRSAIKQLDFTPPTSTATILPVSTADGWYNSPVEVNFSAVDDTGGAGVKQITYSATGATEIAETTVNISKDPFAFPRPGTASDILSGSVTIDGEGITTLTYFAKDKNGNAEAPKTMQIKIDYTAPRSTATILSGNNSNNTANISLTATDVKLVFNPQTEQNEPDPNFPVSGTSQIKYSIDNAAEQTFSSAFNFTGATGTHTLFYYTIDKAGNVEEGKTEYFTFGRR